VTLRSLEIGVTEAALALPAQIAALKLTRDSVRKRVFVFMLKILDSNQQVILLYIYGDLGRHLMTTPKPKIYNEAKTYFHPFDFEFCVYS